MVHNEMNISIYRLSKADALPKVSLLFLIQSIENPRSKRPRKRGSTQPACVTQGPGPGPSSIMSARPAKDYKVNFRTALETEILSQKGRGSTRMAASTGLF